MIADVMEKVGKDGVITVEESQRHPHGDRVRRGHAARPRLRLALLRDQHGAHGGRPRRALHPDHRQEDLRRAGPPPRRSRRSLQVTKNFVIIADDVDGEALATLVVNKLRGTINALAVKAPGFGDRRKAMLEDIAILTGGTFITEDMGRKLENVDRSPTSAAPAASSPPRTTRQSSKATAPTRRSRPASSRSRPRSTRPPSDFDREKLQERLAKLAGGVAVIKVGAATEVELKEKKLRVEDALSRDPRRRRRGHRPRRRRRPDPCPQGPRRARQQDQGSG